MFFKGSGGAENSLLFIRNRHGQQISFVYDAGLLSRIVSPSGRYIQFAYDPNNRVSVATDHTGRAWSYAYSPVGMLTRVTYPDLTHEDIAYDTTTIDILPAEPFVIHRVKSIHNRRGFRELLNTYESSTLDPGLPASYRVVKQVLADDSEINIRYSHFDGINYGVLVTNQDGSKRRVVFGADLYQVSDTLGYGTPQAQTFRFERDAGSGQITARIDPLMRRTEYQYNANGQVIKMTSQAGTTQPRSMLMTYNSDGDPTQFTDPLNRVSSLNYVDGCLSQVTDALGHSTTLVCNGAGKPIRVTDALGKTTYFFYEGSDLTAVVDPLNRATGFAYDRLGRLVVVRDAQGRISRREYDSNDRVKKIIDPQGNATELAYDGNGNLSEVLKPHGNGVTHTYDSRDRLLTRTDSLSQIERWTYDLADRVDTYTDRKLQVTNVDYDVLGRPTTMAYQDGSTTVAFP